MQEASQSSLDLTFPKEYLKKLEKYRSRRDEFSSKPRRMRKPPSTPNVFSDNCKQAIPLANRVYCSILKELVHGSICKGCPCYEQEPLEYTLFRRV